MTEKKYITNKRKYVNTYNSSNYIQVILRIRADDIDVINKLNSVNSKNGYILDLIKNDIKNK